uniref:Uncharacterized protein n=1 Tax=Anabas testudineus TaxID=64144 RepID=A0A3Q1JMG1_ANATE
MAALRACLTLSICILLSQESFAKNDAPCQLSKWNNGYDTFIKRHIPSGTPDSLNQNDWEKFIRTKGCSRPTQSFLSTADLERVKDVCTNRGGKVYKDNLCISRQPFTFVTVRSEMNTCGIKSIRKETKHLILACELMSTANSADFTKTTTLLCYVRNTFRSYLTYHINHENLLKRVKTLDGCTLIKPLN